MTVQVPARRLLLLVPFPPRLDAKHGGGKLIAQMIGALSAHYEIGLIYFRASGELPVDEFLQQHCTLIEEVDRPPIRHSLFDLSVRKQPLWVSEWSADAFAARVRAVARAWQPDIVQIEYHIMGQYLSALDDCPAPRVLTEHDPGTQAARDQRDQQQGFARLPHYLNVWTWERFERAIFRKVQAVVVFTERDRHVIAPLARLTPVVQITPGTLLPAESLNPFGASPPQLLFVGNFVHAPNVDAAMRLIGQIFPAVRKHYPRAKLLIVGDHPTVQLQQMAGDNVVITGCVPDVTTYLDDAAVVVVPLRLGGGIRVKVLEAMASGKAVLASPLAVEGLDLSPSEHVMVAETDEQFSAGIIELLSNPPSRAALASRARTWAEENLGWQKAVTAYDKLYQSLIDGQSIQT